MRRDVLDLREFYAGLLDCLRRPELRQGRWRLLDCRAAWDENRTWKNFLAFAWEGPNGRRLLVAVWERRADWAVEGHWLSINLPASVPAPLTQALMGRDKIGSTSDILDPRPERIVYRLRRGHPGTTIPGDENSHLKAGAITVVRQRWLADAPMPDDLISDWNSAIAK